MIRLKCVEVVGCVPLGPTVKFTGDVACIRGAVSKEPYQHLDWQISMNNPSNVLDLMQKAKELSGDYENVVLTEINDHVVRISLMTETYFWHFHPNSDESFLVLEGLLILELDGRHLELRPGQMFTVPRGVKHRTAPAGAHSVNLTIERADIETVRVEG
jgi:mannose-6-phosphate isomerase-like protein (cupin superfamily)